MSFCVEKFSIFEPFSAKIRHGYSTRHCGMKGDGNFESMNLGFHPEYPREKTIENFRIFCSALGVDFSRIAFAEQVHKDNIAIIDDGFPLGLDNPFQGVDGFITASRNLPLTVHFADCQGCLFFDSRKNVIGAVHCGWKGNSQNILGKTVATFIENFGSLASDIFVAISPSLGPCCGEFTDPIKELPAFMHQFAKGRMVNLWECSKKQLMDAGLPERNIEIAGICTVCNKEKYFSYRGLNKKTGLMSAVIELK